VDDPVVVPNKDYFPRIVELEQARRAELTQAASRAFSALSAVSSRRSLSP